MGCRRLEALINGLPPTSSSALARELNEGIRIGWGFNEELLTALIEVLDVGNRNFLLANGVKMHQLPKAVYINRPLQPKAPPKKAAPDDIKRIFDGGAFIKAAPEEALEEVLEENDV